MQAMAERRFCDCGCAHELDEFDAGQMPTVFRSPSGVMLKIDVLADQRGRLPHVRVGCLRKLIEGAELVFPTLPLVDDTSETPDVVQLPKARKG